MRSKSYLLRLTAYKKPVFIVEYTSLGGIVNFINSMKPEFLITTTKIATPYSVEVEASPDTTGDSNFSLDRLYILDTRHFISNDESMEKIKIALLKSRLDA